MSNIFLISSKVYDEVISLPLIEIEYLDLNIDITEYNALIFTSQNAIESLDKSKLEWKKIPSYVIASKTAQYLKNKNGNLAYTGINSHGNEFANELIDKLKNKKVLYVRGEKNVSSLFEILKNSNIDIEELFVYKTICSKKDFEKPKNNSVIIFTSPSTIECFFKRFSWDESFKAITIGKTTSKYLPEGVEYYISDEQSIEACISLAHKIIKN